MTAPNILLIMADQLSAPFLSAYGGSTVVSPTIDALAADGVVFESAYSNSPLCAPSRFSMMSGRLPSRIGAYDNAAEFPASVPTFAHHLRAAGYQTSLVGKMHFVGPDQLHGYEERPTTDIYPADFGWTPDWRDPDGRFDWWFHNMDSVVNAGVADVSNQLDYDDEVGFEAVRKIRDLGRTSDNRPWMVTVSFTHPHDPYVARREFWDLYHEAEIALPAVGRLADDDVDPHSRRLRQVIGADMAEVDEAMIRKARRAYFASISYVDHWVARLREVLSRHRLDENTVIILTSDHGDMLGERGLWYKMSFFEHSVRVPFIVHHPSRFESGRVAARASLLDLAPTLIELAGAEPDPALEGDSLVPLLHGGTAPSFGDRTVAGEYLGEGAVAPIVMLRRGEWKYVSCPADPPQLFNLDTDPHELANVAADLDNAAVTAGFEAEVAKRWSIEQIDGEVRASQGARRLIDRALRQGRYRSWDHQPPGDAANQYMRNHLDLNDVESSRRA